MAQWVTGAAIIAQAGAAPGSDDEQAWAEICAAAISAGLDSRLEGAWEIEPDPLPPELTWSALTAGVEAYKRREATFGITGYVDLQGAAIRVARDYLEAVAPMIERYATRGIA